MSDDEASEPEIVSSLPKCDDVEECRGHWDALDDQINVRILCRNVRLAVLMFRAEGKEDDRYHPIHDINEKILSIFLCSSYDFNLRFAYAVVLRFCKKY